MNPAPASTTAPQQPLSELENEVIALFVDLVRWFGAPKSLGAIYGLLFVSESPICFEQVATRLQMSNGSVSQGLRLLKDLGAVKVTFMAGERRDFFVAETQLRQLVTGFLRQKIENQLINGEGRLSQLFNWTVQSDSQSVIASRTLQERIALLKRWQRQARATLPVVLEMLQS
ncbi:GbsR/MarR family transcriptional regulator [Verrucomicrobiota bacterium sgz303538]